MSKKVNYEEEIMELLEKNVLLFSELINLKYKAQMKGDNNRKAPKANQGNDSKSAQVASKAEQYNKKGRKPNTTMAGIRENKAKNLPIVAEEYNKNTPVTEIAAKIGMSVPTVRNYIAELRKENQVL